MTQADITVNYGKDFSRDTLEVVAQGEPGGYLVMNAITWNLFSRQASVFLDREWVCFYVFLDRELVCFLYLSG